MPKILVVDDVQDNVTLLTFELEDRGYEVASAASGAEALALAASDAPDAVLLDIMMPEIDGIEVCRRLKADPTLARVPVILVTAKNRDEDVVAGLDAGADDYVSKPFNIRVLLARLETALRGARAQEAIRRANDELREANRKLDEKSQRLAELNRNAFEFVDDVSHEFRTPLSVIKEFTSIIDDGLAGPVSDDQREYLGIIGNCVDDLAVMVSDMLDTSKLEAGLLTVRRTACTVQEIVEHVRPMMERKAQSRRIALSFNPDPDLPTVWADKAKTVRVLTNLVVNAIKFAGENGHVEVWAHSDPANAEVVVGVTDDGPGIDPDKLDVVFERFKQVGRDARASAKGVGLGLNIAKELVALGMGQMTVESQLGHGATFAFTLPTADPERLIERYLAHPELARNRLRHVSLLVAVSAEQCVNGMMAEVDELLHDVLRSSDLALWTGPRQWLLVLDEDAPQSESVLERIQQGRAEINRNRPRTPLPELALSLEGTWQPETQRDELIAAFQQHLESAGSLYAAASAGG
ncbi:MAG: hybrid sensor histidine kinase/response regulator [Pirellulales bacterium]|nr:hybrid sensor histidine kinase/response regulator [Pirellulales bacterium]